MHVSVWLYFDIYVTEFLVLSTESPKCLSMSLLLFGFMSGLEQGSIYINVFKSLQFHRNAEQQVLLGYIHITLDKYENLFFPKFLAFCPHEKAFLSSKNGAFQNTLSLKTPFLRGSMEKMAMTYF